MREYDYCDECGCEIRSDLDLGMRDIREIHKTDINGIGYVTKHCKVLCVDCHDDSIIDEKEED